jgi:pseudouridylate synthase
MPVQLGDTPLVLAPEVKDALASDLPVVALESSVIAHGLPYPGNVQTAGQLDRAVREAGAVPAVVAICDGQVRIGADDVLIHQLATASAVPKAGNRDIGVLLAKGGLAATTLSATLAMACHAGISVVAAGGIGGVHRGAAETFDISADLTELSRSRAVVVCGGAKSILDIGLTLEYLETLGVPVIGYDCADFPAYYCATSGYPVPRRIDHAGTIAAAARLHWRLGLGTGVLVAAPIPAAHALPADELDGAISAALAAASAEGVRGQALTPYLMKAVGAATGGRSAAANQAVLLNSARLASQIAAHLPGHGTGPVD